MKYLYLSLLSLFLVGCDANVANKRGSKMTISKITERKYGWYVYYIYVVKDDISDWTYTTTNKFNIGDELIIIKKP